VATFATLEEAKRWLNSQPEPPRQVFVTVAGEYYLAAYHYKINLRALYPIPMAAGTRQAEK
jgi:ABC-type nitrate/sulfonate/bicarbonate transport system substrate-binding protein